MLNFRIYIFIWGFFISMSSFAQESSKMAKQKAVAEDKLTWLDWNEGYVKAMKSGKIVLVDAYTDWCGWCKKMDRDTYSQTDVIKKINENFVPVKFNPELPINNYMVGDDKMTGQQLYNLLTQGKPTGFPTIYYIFPAKKSIQVDPGYKGPLDFMGILDRMVIENKK